MSKRHEFHKTLLPSYCNSSPLSSFILTTFSYLITPVWSFPTISVSFHKLINVFYWILFKSWFNYCHHVLHVLRAQLLASSMHFASEGLDISLRITIFSLPIKSCTGSSWWCVFLCIPILSNMSHRTLGVPTNTLALSIELGNNARCNTVPFS